MAKNYYTESEIVMCAYMPIEILEKNAYEKISIKGRPLALISTIANSIETLRSSLDYRNSLIDKFKRLFPTIPEKSRLDYYFGFPLPGDSVNQEYFDSMKGIYQYTDDVIFFSSLLCDDLKLHGEALRKSYRKTYGSKVDSQRRSHSCLRDCNSPKMGLKFCHAHHCTINAEKILGELAFLC